MFISSKSKIKVLLLVFLTLCLCLPSFAQLEAAKAKQPTGLKKILLIPLDSRPPCHEYVVDAASIAGVEVISPPDEYLDKFYKVGDSLAIAQWLEDNYSKVDVAVISIDQLFHGGLIASREFNRTYAHGKMLHDFLVDLHEDHPEIPLYVSGTLTRITPTASISDSSLWPVFIEYSRLIDQQAQHPDEEKTKRLAELKNILPADGLEKYIKRYDHNEQLIRELIDLTRKGVIKKLVIGQDDGEEYGIPNMKKRNLRQYAASLGLSGDDVVTINGADEIGLSMVAKLIAEDHKYVPKIRVEYNDPSVPALIMPYMADNVETTVKERLKYFGAEETDSDKAADTTLIVSCVGKDTLSSRQTTSKRIKELIDNGSHPALVDLSIHFDADETVFPFLLKSDTAIQNLSTYAGWNTLSNSVGTALSELIIFNAALKDAETKKDHYTIWQKNSKYLNESFLEDYYYLKDDIVQINSKLRMLGENVNNFASEKDYAIALQMLQDAMLNRSYQLKATKSFQLPVIANTPQGQLKFKVTDMKVVAFYPWPRTFEIDLSAYLDFEEVK